MLSHRRVFSRVAEARNAYLLPTKQNVPELAPFISDICAMFVPVSILQASQTGLNSPRNSNHVNLLVVVVDRPNATMRWKNGEMTADLHVGNLSKLRLDLRKGESHEATRLYGSAGFVHGDDGVARELIDTARDRLLNVPATLSGTSLFKARTDSFDLLSSYLSLQSRKSVGGGVVLSKLISSSIDAFIARNKIWQPNVGLIHLVIRERDPECADILESVLNSSVEQLRDQPELIVKLVHSLAGLPQIDYVIPVMPST